MSDATNRPAEIQPLRLLHIALKYQLYFFQLPGLLSAFFSRTFLMVVFGAKFPEGCEGAFKRPCFHMFSVNEQKGSVEKDGKKTASQSTFSLKVNTCERNLSLRF